MSVLELIRKKRDGEELSENEIKTFVNHLINGTIQECQIGAYNFLNSREKGIVSLVL
jgi:thymidine phosphorylase